MTSPVIDRWHDFISGGQDPALLDALLADDVVFHSPALHSPQEGRAKTTMYLTAAGKLFGGTDFHYVSEWFCDHSAILEFVATIDGKSVNGIDKIVWNEADLITSFTVMIRPFTGLQLVMGKMAELLTASG